MNGADGVVEKTVSATKTKKEQGVLVTVFVKNHRQSLLISVAHVPNTSVVLTDTTRPFARCL